MNELSMFGRPIDGTGKGTNYSRLRSLPAKLLKTSFHDWPQNSSSNATSRHEPNVHKDNMLSICHVIAVKVVRRADGFHQCHDPQVGLR